MRRYGDLWLQICDRDNLDKAAKKACKSRKDKVEVAAFLADRDRKLEELRLIMLNNQYHSSSYRIFIANDRGKRREIADLPLYPDRIAHWAVALVVEPLLNKRIIPQSHASRKRQGAHSAVKQLYGYIQSDPKVRYALKMDVSKFFPSIDKGLLKQMIRRYIKDPDLLFWFDCLIDEYPFPGIPIGNRTSPLLANLYLSSVDNLMKQQYHCHYYVRYMDDIIILGYSKPWLHQQRENIAEALAEKGLKLKGNWQVFPIDDRGIDFVGYRVFTDHILLRKSTKTRMKRKLSDIRERQKAGEELTIHDKGTLSSYNGVLKWCDSYKLRRRNFYKIERDLEYHRPQPLIDRSISQFYTYQMEVSA